MTLPTDAAARKRLPIYSGVICYFPHAIAAVAELSKIGNDQHNPGQPLHWAKEKSSDEMDAMMRHVVDQAIDPAHRDPDGVMAAVKKAWRALADLERMHDAGVNIFADTPTTATEIAMRPELQPTRLDGILHGMMREPRKVEKSAHVSCIRCGVTQGWRHSPDCPEAYG